MSDEAQKSSSDILNELFSTFNSSSSDSNDDVDTRIKKHRKTEEKKEKKKKKHPTPSSSSSPVKKKKKLKPPEESSDSIPIGDGFVVLKKSKVKELEDGEIIKDDQSSKVKKKRKREEGGVFSGSSGSSSGGVKKLSASQAYKLDAEERLLLGYDGKKKRSNSPSRRSSSSSHKSEHYSRERSPSSSSRSRRSSRSRSPQKPRLAPPRDSYRNSYMKFEKQSSYDNYDHHDSGRSYDTASYYDYHAQRSRESNSGFGFGYVSKSYYYDDVEDDKARESSRDKSSSRDSSRDNRDDKRYGTDKWRHSNRSRSRSPPRTPRSYYHPDDIIDKAQLLELARKNAKKLMKSGVLPSDIFSRDQILALKAGGKSVDELTQYCKKLARREEMGDARSDSDNDEGPSHFIHHPFQVKDKPLPTITLNIRNAVPLPVRTPQELAIDSAKLRTQFPVSSGTQHRFKEIEWKPVDGDKDKKEDPNSKAVVPLDDKSTSSATGPNVATIAPMIKELAEEENPSSTTTELKAIEAPPPPPLENTGISVDGPGLPLTDISSVIGLRLKAMRALQENPGCGQAKDQLNEATKMMKDWADAKALEPKFLTPAELSSGPQAWAKRDQLRKTRALDSGMGMHLLQKMGWRPGEGLGKNNEGQLEPLALDVKTDKQGLTAAVEELMYGKSKGTAGGPSLPIVYDLSGKHPVSALMELTAKRRWGNPEFELCFEQGPAHARQFGYKAIVNGVEYQPVQSCGNKKQAKANAAAFCLQSLGLLPTNCQMGPGELLQTVNVNNDNGGGVDTSGGSSNSLSEKFGAPSFLQTVKVAPQPVPPPSHERLLMPPPPPQRGK